MKQVTSRQHTPAIIAIALPLILVIVIAIIALLPNLGPKPQYDFLYSETSSRSYVPSNGGCEYYDNYYTVENGQIIEKPFDLSVLDDSSVTDPCHGYAQKIEKEAPNIFLYDFKTNTSKQLQPADLINLVSNGSVISPDGYRVGKRLLNDSGIFGIFSNNHGGVYASKKDRYIRLDIGSTDSYYDSDFQFISWVNSK